MGRTLIHSTIGLAAAAAIAIVLAACGGGGGQSAGPATGKTTVAVRSVPGVGTVLVDAQGRPLYRSDQEQGGKVLCTGACLSFWQPLTVAGAPSKAASLEGALGTVMRPDGSRQVTYNGQLLYTFTLDRTAKVGGDGVKDAFAGRRFSWHVVHAGGIATAPAANGPATPSY